MVDEALQDNMRIRSLLLAAIMTLSSLSVVVASDTITTQDVKTDQLGNATDKLNDGTDYLDIASSGSLQVISDAIDQVAGYKADWGAGQNRLEYTVSNLMNVVEFTSAARSRIQDADFAVEAARLSKAQILQQTGAAMLAQANASPQLAISLLQ